VKKKSAFSHHVEYIHLPRKFPNRRRVSHPFMLNHLSHEVISTVLFESVFNPARPALSGPIGNRFKKNPHDYDHTSPSRKI
jgi:hypothetical protein